MSITSAVDTRIHAVSPVSTLCIADASAARTGGTKAVRKISANAVIDIMFIRFIMQHSSSAVKSITCSIYILIKQGACHEAEKMSEHELVDLLIVLRMPVRDRR